MSDLANHPPKPPGLRIFFLDFRPQPPERTRNGLDLLHAKNHTANKMMSSPLKKQPEAVADRVLKRAEISKVCMASLLPPLAQG